MMDSLPKATRVLIVEDDPSQLEIAKRSLQNHGTFNLTIARDAQSMFDKLTVEIPDVILMDLGLPDCDGIDICRRLKEEERFRWIPIIMLTARANVTDKITGLEVGADDYLVKPYDPGELVARIRAILRRKQALGPITDYDQNGLKISAERRQVWIDNEIVSMTPKEFDLLLLLVSKRGAVLSREDISQAIWGKSAMDSARTLDTHIWRLRSKLGSVAPRIETVGKNGYRFNN